MADGRIRDGIGFTQIKPDLRRASMPAEWTIPLPNGGIVRVLHAPVVTQRAVDCRPQCPDPALNGGGDRPYHTRYRLGVTDITMHFAS